MSVFNRVMGGLLGVFFLISAVSAEELNIYSARHYDTDLEIYERFSEETGIKINLIEGQSEELLARLAQEGEFSPGDVLLTVDAGRLWRAEQAGLFAPVSSEIIDERIPSHLRHPEGLWFGISKRARIVIFNKETGAPQGLARLRAMTPHRSKLLQRENVRLVSPIPIMSVVCWGLMIRRTRRLPGKSALFFQTRPTVARM